MTTPLIFSVLASVGVLSTQWLYGNKSIYGPHHRTRLAGPLARPYHQYGRLGPPNLLDSHVSHPHKELSEMERT